MGPSNTYRVLIVDDRDEDVVLLEELVRSKGFFVDRARTWNEALTMLREHGRRREQYAALFLDLDLGITPNDGFVLMERMKSEGLVVPTQVVSYSADLMGGAAQAISHYPFALHMPIKKEAVLTLRDFIFRFLEDSLSHPRQEVRIVDNWQRQNVFVVHGREEGIRRATFAFLSSLALKPIHWNKAVQMTEKSLPYVGEVLDAAFGNAQATVVLLTPDDEGRLRKHLRLPNDTGSESHLTGQPRLNVVFEAGLALGRHPERTLIVELGDLRSFSDLLGRHTIRMDNSVAQRQALALRLEKAGCAVDMSGIDWHSAGDFSASASGIVSRRPATGGRRSRSGKKGGR